MSDTDSLDTGEGHITPSSSVSHSDAKVEVLLHSSSDCEPDDKAPSLGSEVSSSLGISDASVRDPCFSSPLKRSPPSSPVGPARKRAAYSAYKHDPLVPIPRQTLDRWEKAKCDANQAAEDENMSVNTNVSHESQPASACVVVDKPHLNEEETVEETDHVVVHQPHLNEEDTVEIGSVVVVDQPHLNQGETVEEIDCSDDSSSDDSSDGSNDSSNEDFDSSFEGGSVNVSVSDFDNSLGCRSDDENDDDDNDVDGNLYQGCEKTVDVAVLELLEIYIKNYMSKTALQDFLTFYVSSLPIGHGMPSTVYHLFNYVKKRSIPLKEIPHFYCVPRLHKVLDKDGPCSICNSTSIGVFYELPIDTQIKYLFEHRDLANVIDSYREKRSHVRDGMCDVLDGSEYHRVWQGVVDGSYKLTLILNTDGVQPHESSSADFWPVMFTIMEVPPHLRSSFTIVCGIWFDKHLKPDMNLYLEPFVRSLQEIHRKGGVTWKHPVTEIEHKSPVRAPLIVADAPARAGVLNMQQHNANYACNTCEQKTNKLPAPPVVEGQKKKRRKRRFLFKENPSKLRTHQRMLQQGAFASRYGTVKRGLKGSTVIRDIDYLHLSTCVLPEYFHSVLKGVVLQFTSLWFYQPGDWFIGNKMDEINHFLLNDIHPPDFVTRLPKSLQYLSSFKANELRSWLLYYSPIVVSTYMPVKYAQHWLLLVGAMFLLLQESISENDLVCAEAMLKLFLRDIGSLYGDAQYVYNVHQLSHFILHTRRWGPAWATSAFGFENFNGVLARMIHGSKNEGKELVNEICIAQGIQMLRSKVKQRMYDARCSSFKVLGKPFSLTLTVNESDSLKDFDLDNIKFYGRASFERDTYSSQVYDKEKKRRNSYIEFSNNGQKHYGRILFFFTVEDKVLCLVNVLKVVHTKVLFHTASRYRIHHIIPVQASDQIIVCDMCNVHQKLIQVENYLCMRPNSFERNL